MGKLNLDLDNLKSYSNFFYKCFGVKLSKLYEIDGVAKMGFVDVLKELYGDDIEIYIKSHTESYKYFDYRKADILDELAIWIGDSFVTSTEKIGYSYVRDVYVKTVDGEEIFVGSFTVDKEKDDGIEKLSKLSIVYSLRNGFNFYPISGSEKIAAGNNQKLLDIMRGRIDYNLIYKKLDEKILEFMSLEDPERQNAKNFLMQLLDIHRLFGFSFSTSRDDFAINLLNVIEEIRGKKQELMAYGISDANIIRNFEYSRQEVNDYYNLFMKSYFMSLSSSSYNDLFDLVQGVIIAFNEYIDKRLYSLQLDTSFEKQSITLKMQLLEKEIASIADQLKKPDNVDMGLDNNFNYMEKGFFPHILASDILTIIKSHLQFERRDFDNNLFLWHKFKNDDIKGYNALYRVLKEWITSKNNSNIKTVYDMSLKDFYDFLEDILLKMIQVLTECDEENEIYRHCLSLSFKALSSGLEKKLKQQ